MRTLTLVQWLEQRDIPARAAYRGQVRSGVHYEVLAAHDRWAVEFDDGVVPVCWILPSCPQEREISGFFERSLDRRGRLDPQCDQAHRFLPAPPPPRVAAPPPLGRRTVLEGVLVRLAWLTVGILSGLAL